MLESNSQMFRLHSKINAKMFQSVKAPGVQYTEDEEPQLEDD
jgi:hypothetical protein